MWRLSRLRSFSKIEWNRYRDFLEQVWLDCDNALTARHWSDFKAQIRSGKRDSAINYTLQYAWWQPCDGRVPARPHSPPAVIIDVHIDLHCTAAIATSPSLLPINGRCNSQWGETRNCKPWSRLRVEVASQYIIIPRYYKNYSRHVGISKYNSIVI